MHKFTNLLLLTFGVAFAVATHAQVEYQTVIVEGVMQRSIPMDSPIIDTPLYSVGRPSSNQKGTLEKSATDRSPVPSDKNAPDDPENQSPVSCNPVILANGQKTLTEIDFQHASIPEFTVKRVYDSGGGPTGLGAWVFPIIGPRVSYSLVKGTGGVDTPIGALPDTLTYTRATGGNKRYLTDLNGFGVAGNYNYYPTGKNSSTSVERVYFTASTIEHVDDKGVRYVFGRSPRILQSIYDRQGQLYTYTYSNATSPTLPTAIRHRSGQIMTLTWNGSNISSIAVNGIVAAQYTYANNMVTKVTYADGSYKDYFYEQANGMYGSPPAPYLLTGYAVNGLRITNYQYNGVAQVISSGSVDGENRDTFSYSFSPPTTTQTQSNGQVTNYIFESLSTGFNRLKSVTSNQTSTCAGATRLITYDVNGNIDYELDWNGNKTDYTYDAKGYLLDKTLAAGTTIQSKIKNTWSTYGIVKEEVYGSTGALVRTTNTTYYSAAPKEGLLASRSMVDAATGIARNVAYDYAFYGTSGVISSKTISRQLPQGWVSQTYNYSTSGNLSSIVNELGQAVQFLNYDFAGRAGSSIDVNGVQTDFTYDQRGNLTSKTLVLPSGNRTETYAYDARNQLISVTRPDGSFTSYTYNLSGRVTSVGNALGETVSSALNLPTITTTSSSNRNVPSISGSSISSTPAGQFSTVIKSDSRGRVIERAGNNGQSFKTSYDGNGNSTSQSDAANRSRTLQYDALDRLTQTTEPDGGITYYTYTPAGYLATVKDPRGLITSYTYNGFGDVLTRVSPDTGTTSYGYDIGGRLISEAKGGVISVAYTWDALDRMTSRTSGGVTESFTFDEGVYGKGRLTRLNDASGQTTFTYTAAGELAQQVNTIVGSTYTTSWLFDANGRLSTATYPNGLSLGYGYDAYGRLSGITSNLGGAWATLVDSFLYQPATNQRYAWRFGNLIRNESKPGSSGEPLGPYAGVLSPRSPSRGLQPDPVPARHVVA